MAISQVWGFTRNTFLNSTKGSYRLAVRISTYHLAAISKKAGDPVFDAMITNFTPLHLGLKRTYKEWLSQGGNQQGRTMELSQLLKLLSAEKIKQWDVAIQAVFVNTTPEYKALLPRYRVPFQTGSQEDRVTSVAALAQSLLNIAPLAAVKTDVDDFSKQISASLLNQKGEISVTKTISDAVEADRVAMCIGMYANLGGLIQLYAATPFYIDQYFDLAVIRRGAQLVFTGDTKPAVQENIFKHTFNAADKLLLKNEGITELVFYLANTKKDTPGSNIIKLSPASQQTIGVEALGSLTNTFFNVLNTDVNNVGEWTVEFV